MSPREKKLLIFFAIAGFLVLNFLLLRVLSKPSAPRWTASAIWPARNSKPPKCSSASREQVTDQMEWLAKHEPEPAANQDVQTKLQQLCESEAKTAGLTIKSQKPTAHRRHGRAVISTAPKSRSPSTAAEEALYRWFDRLNIPEQLRIASNIRLSPNKQDDTKIDCTATIEQWFVPLPPAT